MKTIHYEVTSNGKKRAIAVLLPESSEEAGENARKWNYEYARWTLFDSDNFSATIRTIRHFNNWCEEQNGRYVDTGPRDIAYDNGDVALKTRGRWGNTPRNGSRAGWPKDELGHPIDYVVCSYPTKLKHRIYI